MNLEEIDWKKYGLWTLSFLGVDGFFTWLGGAYPQLNNILQFLNIPAINGIWAAVELFIGVMVAVIITDMWIAPAIENALGKR